MDVSRREFLTTTSAAVLAAGTMARSSVFGANDRIRVAVIGLCGRGGHHVQSYLGMEDTELVALCDVDEQVLDFVRAKAQEKTGKTPKRYVDLRDLLADPEVDAVSIATPNHWHALAAIWAAQAGKHVYVEKPASWSVYEGRQLAAAAEKYDVIMQHGTQGRSKRRWLRDIELLRAGAIIGPLYMARGLCYKNGGRGSLGFKPDGDPPAQLHWDLWQGPAERRAYNPNYVHYNWHWFWRYGNGEIGNQGAHQLDIGVWAMDRGLPVKVTSDGGRYTYEDQGETPNTNVATFTYEDGTMFVFEVRNRFTNHEEGVDVGNLFYGNEGYYVEGQGFFDTGNRKIELDEKEYPIPECPGAFQTFANAVKSGKKSEIHGTMRDAHIGQAHAHLANIAYRLGCSLRFDPKKERFVDAPRGANALLTRDYAKGFEVPRLA